MTATQVTQKENTDQKTAGKQDEVKQQEKGGSAGSTRPIRKKNPRRPRRRRERPRSELQHRVIDIRRVTRVMAGGRRFSFSVVVVAGTRKGAVGVGVGKAGDTALAIEKALRDARKHMVYVALTEEASIVHDVEAKYAGAVVRIMPVAGSQRVTAGGAVRTVLAFAGVKGVTAKIVSRTKNKINNARAALLALKQLPGTTEKVYVEKSVKKVASRSDTSKKESVLKRKKESKEK